MSYFKGKLNHLLAWSKKAKSDISNSKFPLIEMFFTKMMVGANLPFPIHTPQYRTIWNFFETKIGILLCLEVL